MRADLGKRDGLALSKIGCAADHLERLVRTEVDGGKSKPVGVGVLFDSGDATDDDLVPFIAAALDRLDFCAGHAEPMGQFLDRQIPVDIPRKPLEWDVHQAVPRNWSNSRRKRTSLR